MEESTQSRRVASVSFCDQNDIVLNPWFKDNDEVAGNGEVSQDPEGSSKEDSNRELLKILFDQLDSNQRGFLVINELASMIRENHDVDLPKHLTKAILERDKTDSEGLLEFEEFFRLSRRRSSLWIQWFVTYCRHPDVQLLRFMTQKVCRILKDNFYWIAGNLLHPPDGVYESQMTFSPPPLTMVMFSVIEIIFFIVDYNMRDEVKYGSYEGPMGQYFMVKDDDCMQIWRYFTYMFVHHKLDHLITNLIIQLFLGTGLELVHCWWRVALVYLSGAIAGSLGTFLSAGHSPIRGASGGTSALLTAHIATVILNWHDMKYATNQLFVLLVCISSEVSFSYHHNKANPDSPTGHMCHLSGAIAGLLVGIGVLRNLNERPIERKIWWISVTTYFCLIIYAISTHVLDPHKSSK